MGHPFFPESCHVPWGICTPSLAVFAGLMIVTDRPTDRHTTRSVTLGHIYIRSIAMWPNNMYISILHKVVMLETEKLAYFYPLTGVIVSLCMLSFWPISELMSVSTLCIDLSLHFA